MARIVVQALHSNGEPRRWTLSERVVAENLDSDHYVTQLTERLCWATEDAQALESESGAATTCHGSDVPQFGGRDQRLVGSIETQRRS